MLTSKAYSMGYILLYQPQWLDSITYSLTRWQPLWEALLICTFWAWRKEILFYIMYHSFSVVATQYCIIDEICILYWRCYYIFSGEASSPCNWSLDAGITYILIHLNLSLTLSFEGRGMECLLWVCSLICFLCLNCHTIYKTCYDRPFYKEFQCLLKQHLVFNVCSVRLKFNTHCENPLFHFIKSSLYKFCQFGINLSFTTAYASHPMVFINASRHNLTNQYVALYLSILWPVGHPNPHNVRFMMP